MDKRRLGQSDLYLAPIMLGGNVFGWMIDEKTSFGILDVSSMAVSMPSTPQIATRAGCPATLEVNRKRSSEIG
jgi:hypothetical protein